MHDGRSKVGGRTTNQVRPHSSLGNLKPHEFSRAFKIEVTHNPTDTNLRLVTQTG
jgi:hypothetical protein